MDAFYASVEQRDHPELRGKPVAVGGARERVVAAASYEARNLACARDAVGHRQTMCPDLIFVTPRFGLQGCIPADPRHIAEYTPIIEPLSLDEPIST